jgi:hypothetical protein
MASEEGLSSSFGGFNAFCNLNYNCCIKKTARQVGPLVWLGLHLVEQFLLRIAATFGA